MGAAWATLIARTLTLIPLLLLTVWRYRLFDRKSADLPRYRSMRALWSVAWPSSTQLVVRIAAMLMLHSLVARFFTTATDQSATTALGVVFRFETMVIFVSLGWGSAAQTFVGQSLGRELPNRAQAAGWWAAGYDAATLALLALLYHAFAGSIVGWFNTTPAVTVIAVQYLQTVAYGYVGLGVGIVLGAAIQGTGATRRSLALDLLLVLVIQLPAALIAVTRPSPSLQALWMTLAGIYLVSALLYAVAYSRGRHLTFRL